MWEEFTEDYTDPKTGSTWTNQKGIKRADGFALMRHGMDKEGNQTFVCKGDFGEFKFYASRWYGELLHGGKLLDTYTVWVNGNPDRGYMDKEMHREFVLNFAKDIESALMAFPLDKTFNTPVKGVLFNISRIPGKPEIIRAEEI